MNVQTELCQLRPLDAKREKGDNPSEHKNCHVTSTGGTSEDCHDTQQIGLHSQMLEA